MNNTQGALHFGAGINMAEWRNNIAEMRRDILGLSNTTQSQTKQMDSSFRMIGTGLATYFSGAALANFTNQIINIRGEFQKTEIAFGTMLKSTDKAKALMGQMVELAAKTPFSLQDVSTGAKQLLAFQVPAEQVVDTLTRMGNIAAGLGVPLGRINLVYGQVMAKGKLAGDDLRQFTEAGIPMLAELAKKFNTSTAEISKMVTAGKIGFKDVQDVLFSMTNEGGMFFNLMEKQSASLSGKMSNLGDTIDQVFNKIGAQSEGFLGGAIDEASYLIENYDTLLEVLGVAIATYGTYKAALIAFAAWQQLSGGAALQQALAQGTLTVAQSYGAAATVALQRAQIGLNAAMMANPIGIVIGLLAGLSYVIYKNVTATNAYIDLQSKLKEENDKNNNSIDEQKSKIESLTNIIKNKNTTDTQAKKALDQINKLTGNRIEGLTVEGIRLGQNTTALQGYIKMLELEARAKSLIATKVDAEKKEREIRGDNFNDLTLGDRFGNFRETKDLGLSAQQRKRKALIEDLQAVWRTKAEIDRELNKLQAQGVNIGDEIAENATASTADTVEKTKNKARELAEIYSLNSIADLEQRISLWNEALQKASGDTVNELTKNKFGDTVKTGNVVTVAQAVAEQEKLEKSKAKRLKEISIQTFDEQMTEMQRQFEVRDMLIAKGQSKENVDAMFPKLKDENLIVNLKNMRDELQGLADSGKATEETANNLFKISEIIDKMEGKESVMDKFTKSLDSSKLGKSSAEYIEWLREQKEMFDDANSNTVDRAKNTEINNRIRAEKEAMKVHFEELLIEQKTYEEKSLELQKEFTSIKASEQYQKSTPEQQQKIDKSFTEKQGILDIDMIQKTAEWQVAFGELEGMTNTSLQLILQRLLDFQAKSKGTLTIKDAAELQKAIDNVRNAANNNPFAFLTSSFSDYRTSLKESKTAQEEYNRVLKETPKDAEKVAAAGEKMVLADKKHLEAKKKLIAGIQDGQQIFNAVGEGVLELGDAFGGMSDATKDAIDDIMAIGNAAMDFATSLASGDVAGMIKAGIKLITSVFKALSGDKKKEREIKKQAAVLKELETAYNAVAFAAERMFGAQKYTGQRDLIRNLEQQKAAIQGMMGAENDKKKKDDEKIAGYQSQIQGINQSIIALKEGIIKDVLQTDIPDMASKLGDALLDAFGKGESGVDAINRAFDDLVKNMLKNQLNKIIEGQMDGVIANMRTAMGFNPDGTGSFDGLTPEEIADLRAQVQAATAQGQQFIDAYSEIFGGLDTPSEGLKGDIKGITEKTAGALEAQINAVRIYQVEANNIHKSNQQTFIASLQQLVQIEYNTRRLHSIDASLLEMNGKMKKQLAGFP